MHRWPSVHVSCFILLLQYGSRALHYAVTNHNVETVAYLAKKGADRTAKTTRSKYPLRAGLTPVELAAMLGDRDTLNLLLAPVVVVDTSDVPPLVGGTAGGADDALASLPDLVA